MKNLFITPLAASVAFSVVKQFAAQVRVYGKLGGWWSECLKARRNEKLWGVEATLPGHPLEPVFHPESFYFKTNLKSQ